MLFLAILLFGTLVGAAARLLLPGRQHLSLSATTVAGLIGAGTAGSLTATIFDRGLSWSGPSIIGSVLGAAVVVTVAEWVTGRRAARDARVPTAELVRAGESDRVEFKSTARHNVRTGEKDPRLELAVARTVVGFANTQGGTLLVGVDDDGRVLGLDADLALVRGGDLDRYQLWLHDLLERCIGRDAHRHVRIGFDRVDGHHVARLEVESADEPLYLRPHTGDRAAQFHVRVGNSTRQLPVDEAVRYVARRSPGRAAVRRRLTYGVGRRRPPDGSAGGRAP